MDSDKNVYTLFVPPNIGDVVYRSGESVTDCLNVNGVVGVIANQYATVSKRGSGVVYTTLSFNPNAYGSVQTFQDGAASRSVGFAYMLIDDPDSRQDNAPLHNVSLKILSRLLLSVQTLLLIRMLRWFLLNTKHTRTGFKTASIIRRTLYMYNASI